MTAVSSRRTPFALLILGLVGCSGSMSRPASVPAAPRSAVFEINGVHDYVRVRVGSAAPAWFIFDTGASSVLDSSFAASLGLRVVAQEQGGGGGEAKVTVRFIDAASLSLVDSAGNTIALVPPERVATVDLSGISKAEGRVVSGVLGASFFRSHAVLVDRLTRTIHVYSLGQFVAPAGWRAVNLQVDGDLIFARAAITPAVGAVPVVGLYEIDTGGGHALILNSPFVRAQKLTGTAVSGDAMVSVGGGAAGARGRIPLFRFAGDSLRDVPAVFSQATGGLFASDEFDGSIGNGLLSRFTGVAFDYSVKRMWLGPLRR